MLEIIEVSAGQVRTLLEENGLPTTDLDPATIKLLAIFNEDAVIGCIGIERYGTQSLIRSLAVEREHRGFGVGASLIDAALKLAALDDATDVFGVTNDAESYLVRFGFETVDREGLIGPITHSTQLQGVCPDTAVVMHRSL